MIEKPFVLDPHFERLLDSGAFRQRVYKMFSGMSARDLFEMNGFMNIPTILTAALGFLADPRIFLATAIWGGIMALIFVISAIDWLAKRDKRERMRRLAFDSDLVTGRIITCERKCFGGSSYKVQVQFAATAPSGKEVKWTQALERDDLLNETLPPPGWPVLVLMVDDTLFFML